MMKTQRTRACSTDVKKPQTLAHAYHAHEHAAHTRTEPIIRYVLYAEVSKHVLEERRQARGDDVTQRRAP